MFNYLLAIALSFCFSTQEILTLTNADILTMVRAGLPSAVIVEKIKKSSGKFDTQPTTIVELSNVGVPGEVLLAMMNATQMAEPCLSERTVTLPRGETLEVEAAFTVISGNVDDGSALSFNVVHPLTVNGVTVISAGTRATGRVTKSKRGSTWGRAGQLAWTMEDVPAVDGSTVPLEFSRSQKGHSKGATVATAVALTSVVFWPAAPLWGFKRGKDARLLAGTRFEVTVRRDTPIRVREVCVR